MPSEKELKKREALQQLLMTMAIELVNVPLEEVDRVIDKMLAALGEFSALDRVYVFHHDFKNRVTINTHEWCAEGITAEIENMQAVPLDHLSALLKLHQKGKIFIVPRVSDLPEDDNFRKIIEPQGIRSLLLLPLILRNKNTGFVGFDAVRAEKEFTAVEISLLRVFAELIVNIEERRQTEGALVAIRTLNESIVQNINEGIIISNLDGLVTFANPTLLKILGYTAAEFIGSHWTLVVPQQFQAVVEAADARRQKGEVDRYELTLKSKEGLLIPVQVSGSPYYDYKTGVITGTVAVMTAIAELKQAQETIKASEERLRLMTRNIQDVVFETDANGYYTYISASSAAVFGYGQELLGQRAFDYIHPDDVERVMMTYISTVESNEAVRTEYRFWHPEKGYIWVEGVGGTYQNSNGETMVLVTVRDIGERKIAEAEIAEKNQILAQLNAFTLEQTQVSSYDKLIDLILEQLISSTGAMGGVYSEYLPEKKAFRVKIIKTADQALADKAVAVAGRKLLEKPLPVSDRRFSFMLEKIVATFFSLSEATDGVVSKSIAHAVSQTFNLQFFVAIAYIIEGKLYGATTLCFTADVQEPSAQFLTSFAHISAISLKRVYNEESLRHLSLHDQLTGLYNRHFFEAELERLARSREYPIAIIAADIDGLKLINDTLGHAKGDFYLQAGADLLKGALRASDILARVGGDEFAIILPRTTLKDGEATVARVRRSITAHNRQHKELPLSLSIGLAVSESSSFSLEEAYRTADNAMYKDKLGRSNKAHTAIINSLINFLYEKDKPAAKISKEVQVLSAKVGRALHLSDSRLSDLALLARVRNLGNITLPEHLYTKEGRLNSDELELISRHAEAGYRIASSAPELAGVADLILKHHENFDGTGYPLGLKGEEIPLECRIIAVCAAYSAMTNPRSYGETLESAEALAELKRCAGSQFDPLVVEAFINIIAPGA